MCVDDRSGTIGWSFVRRPASGRVRESAKAAVPQRKTAPGHIVDSGMT
jgi:hypothetical protein